MAFKYDGSNPFGFRDIAFFMIFFSNNLDIKKLMELEILISIVGCYQGTLKSWESSVQV